MNAPPPPPAMGQEFGDFAPGDEFEADAAPAGPNAPRAHQETMAGEGFVLMSDFCTEDGKQARPTPAPAARRQGAARKGREGPVPVAKDARPEASGRAVPPRAQDPARAPSPDILARKNEDGTDMTMEQLLDFFMTPSQPGAEVPVSSHSSTTAASNPNNSAAAQEKGEATLVRWHACDQCAQRHGHVRVAACKDTQGNVRCSQLALTREGHSQDARARRGLFDTILLFLVLNASLRAVRQRSTCVHLASIPGRTQPARRDPGARFDVDGRCECRCRLRCTRCRSVPQRVRTARGSPLARALAASRRPPSGRADLSGSRCLLRCDCAQLCGVFAIIMLVAARHQRHATQEFCWARGLVYPRLFSLWHTSHACTPTHIQSFSLWCATHTLTHKHTHTHAHTRRC